MLSTCVVPYFTPIVNHLTIIPFFQIQSRALANLEAVLKSAGLELSDVVKVTAWITDANYMTDFILVYRGYFAEPYPTRSTIVSDLVVPDAMVEVEAVAYRESK